MSAATVDAPSRGNVITFPRRRRVENVSLCSDCGTPIHDERTRIFCDPCIEMNDG